MPDLRGCGPNRSPQRGITVSVAKLPFPLVLPQSEAKFRELDRETSIPSEPSRVISRGKV